LPAAAGVVAWDEDPDHGPLEPRKSSLIAFFAQQALYRQHLAGEEKPRRHFGPGPDDCATGRRSVPRLGGVPAQMPARVPALWEIQVWRSGANRSGGATSYPNLLGSSCTMESPKKSPFLSDETSVSSDETYLGSDETYPNSDETSAVTTRGGLGFVTTPTRIYSHECLWVGFRNCITRILTLFFKSFTFIHLSEKTPVKNKGGYSDKT
jgi:hypothetical protein